MSEYAQHLLPSGATGLEKALSTVDAERLALLPPQVLLGLLDPQSVPKAFLPALAVQRSVEEEWHLARTESQQRDLLANAYALNARKGTPFAIKRGLAVLGFPGVTLIEGFPTLIHDGAIGKRNGRERYRTTARWALFDVRLPLAADQALDDAERARVLAGIEIWQRAACYLRALRAVANLEILRLSDAAAAITVHVGLKLPARRDTPRDGRFRRGGVLRHRYGGLDLHAGAFLRDGAALPLPADVLRFGVQQVDPRLGVHLHLRQDRPASLRFDAAIRRDGSLPRGFNGALVRQHRRVGWGGLAAAAERAHLRGGLFAFDGSVMRGPGLPAAAVILRARRLLRHDGQTARGSGPLLDGSALRNGAVSRDTAPRYTADGRLGTSLR